MVLCAIHIGVTTVASKDYRHWVCDLQFVACSLAGLVRHKVARTGVDVDFYVLTCFYCTRLYSYVAVRRI
jgi:hypothetical protein